MCTRYVRIKLTNLRANLQLVKFLKNFWNTKHSCLNFLKLGGIICIFWIFLYFSEFSALNEFFCIYWFLFVTATNPVHFSKCLEFFRNHWIFLEFFEFLIFFYYEAPRILCINPSIFIIFWQPSHGCILISIMDMSTKYINNVPNLPNPLPPFYWVWQFHKSKIQ
jgi:hypothetical protein